VSALFDSRQRGGTLDYTGFHLPALDGLLRAAADAPEGVSRHIAWQNLQAMLDRLAPATWIYHARGVQGVSRRVRGARMDLRGELVTVHDWSLAPRSRSR
jgi:peptide/nickel transport system substrate-binding protein